MVHPVKPSGVWKRFLWPACVFALGVLSGSLYPALLPHREPGRSGATDGVAQLLGGCSQAAGSGGGVSSKHAAAVQRLVTQQYSLPEELLDQGLIYNGDAAPARQALRKLLDGKPFTAVAVGGSVTYGRGSSEIGHTDWVALVFAWMRTTFPGANLTLVNAAVAASPSEYMAFCMHQHVPPNPDLIILEYNINDGLLPWEHAHRRSYERLMRRLLELPSRPLVVPLMLYNYHRYQHNGTFTRTGEDMLGTLSQYYRLPWVSMRGVVHHPVAQGQDGFIPEQWLNVDKIHPTDRGHDYVAQLVRRYLQRALLDAATVPPPPKQRQAGNGTTALPPPMLPGALPMGAEACLQNQAFKGVVSGMEGFYWEDKGSPERPEIRAETWSQGSRLTITLDTSLPSAPAAAGPAAAAAAARAAKLNYTALFIWHTKSYHWVGDGRASCSGGCVCETQPLRSHLRTIFGTQDHLHLMMVTKGKGCRVTVETTADSSTGGHYFRVKGVVLSTDAAAAPPLEFYWGEELENMPPRPAPFFDDSLGP